MITSYKNEDECGNQKIKNGRRMEYKKSERVEKPEAANGFSRLKGKVCSKLELNQTCKHLNIVKISRVEKAMCLIEKLMIHYRCRNRRHFDQAFWTCI